jgi:hypothetical protein
MIMCNIYMRHMIYMINLIYLIYMNKKKGVINFTGRSI